MERVEFTLGASKMFAALLFILYGGALVIILWLPILFCFKIVVAVGCVYDFFRIHRLSVNRRAKKSVIRVWQDPKGQWGCQTRAGCAAIGTLAGDSYKSPWVLVLRFCFKSRSQTVVIPADAMSAVQYRILRMRLNCF